MSSKLHLSGTMSPPPGGWIFKVNELSVRAPKIAWVVAPTYPDLINEVNKRCKANGIPAPTEEDIQNQICQRAPEAFCRDEMGQPAMQPSSGTVTLAQIVQGTRSLLGWFLHGSVDRQEVIRRTHVCNQCPENLPIAGCSNCAMKGLHDVMNKIVVDPLPSDAMLHACRICSCSLRAKVRMQIDDILPHMTNQQKEQLPDNCWLVDVPKVLVPPILT